MNHPFDDAAPAEPAAGPDLACTCALLRRTSRRITQLYDRALEPVGLRVTQYSLLSALIRVGPVSVSALATQLGTDRTTLTRNLKPLERAGLVAVAAGPDRRSRAVRITPAGHRRREEAVPLWRAAEVSLRDVMGEANQELHRLLEQTLRSTTRE